MANFNTLLDHVISDNYTFILKPSAAVTTSTSKWDQKVQDIDKLLQQIEKKQAIVGMSVGIIADGQAIFSKGYGLRDFNDSKSKVNSQTLFGIGSVTKQFTTYGLDRLINIDGLLSWNDSVRKHIPEFRMYDVFTTERLQLRDCASHHSGLPRHELSHLYSDLKMNDLIGRLPYLKPVYDLRQTWSYNSIMFGVLGVVIERVTGKDWGSFMTERVLNPLHMNDTYTSIEEAEQSLKDIAQPHNSFADGRTKLVPWNNAKAVEAAGAILSTAEDMSKWIVEQLKLTGQSKEMHLAQASISADPTDGDNFAYGYGWMLALFHGRLMIWHSGVTDGFIARVTILPELNQGIVVLANSEALKDFGKQLSLHISDILSGYSTSDSKAVQDWVANLPVVSRTPTRTVKPSAAPTPSTVTKEYFGDYDNPGYGVVNVGADASGSTLVATFNTVKYTLESKGLGSQEFFTAVATYPREMNFGCSFVRDIDNDVCGYKFSVEPMLLEPIYFKKRVSPELLTPEYLNKFVGVYTASPTFVCVNLNKNNQLVTSGAVQFTGVLESVKFGRFLLVAASPSRFQFTVDASDVVTGLTVYIGEYGVVMKRAD